MPVVVVGLSDMKISDQPGVVLVTYALGSCLAVAAHDAKTAVGGMLHVMLPNSERAEEKARQQPCMYADTAIPVFLSALFAAGALKQRLEIKLAGGSSRTQANDVYEIGKRNLLMVKRMLWKSGLVARREDVGGNICRTLHLEIGTGKTWIHSAGTEWEL
ncbi:chemotaxis protein CheD [candidate division FCPU426 bacterium]|nr:chemotaxis protein CheD [candidate division FCPU426 bacterium]